MQRYGAIAYFLALTVWTSALHAEQFEIIDVPSVGLIRQPKPYAIAFANPARLIPFEEWANAMPLHRQLLSPYPNYTEPTVNATDEGMTKPVKEKLDMYVAEARFTVSRPPQSIELARYATLGFLQRLDPAIKHRLISPTEAENNSNKHPDRQWCQAQENVICIQSRYHLEGKLPIALKLVNQVSDSKKLYDYLEFQSELRILAQSEFDQPGLMKLTGLDAPIAGALEQTIFHVNQAIQFGKFLAVLQMSQADPNKTIVTAFIALALKARLLERSRDYENVPVLRNLVPAMVLAGKSSFNTGRSISAGLPLFARNNIRAIAAILDETRPLCPNCSLLQDCLLPLSIVGADAIPRAYRRPERQIAAGPGGTDNSAQCSPRSTWVTQKLLPHHGL